MTQKDSKGFQIPREDSLVTNILTALAGGPLPLAPPLSKN